MRQNGITEINDTNNNCNNKHHKRSAGIFGEASSSKKTKLCVPNIREDSGCSKMPTPLQVHYNIMEKLKDLYKELKTDKSCKEVSD